MRAFYRKYPYLKKYTKYRKYALGGGKGAGCVRQHQAVQAGFVDDGHVLFTAKGVTFRYPLVLSVYMVGKCLSRVGVPESLGHVLAHQPGRTSGTLRTF